MRLSISYGNDLFFTFTSCFQLDKSAFILRKIVKLDLKINLAAATRFVDKRHLLDQLR